MPVFLLTGESGSGKTSLMTALSEILRSRHLNFGGFTAPGIWFNGKRAGFVLHDLKSGTERILAETRGSGTETYGRFVFNPVALRAGNQLLQDQAADPETDIILVDEVGPFELEGGGWSGSLEKLVQSGLPQLWAVRTKLVGPVCGMWRFEPAAVFSASADTAFSVYQKIAEVCGFSKL